MIFCHNFIWPYRYKHTVSSCRPREMLLYDCCIFWVSSLIYIYISWKCECPRIACNSTYIYLYPGKYGVRPSYCVYCLKGANCICLDNSILQVGSMGNGMGNCIQSTLVISNFTGPDKNVWVISSSRQPNCDVIGMTTVRLSVRQNVLGRHMYMAI